MGNTGDIGKLLIVAQKEVYLVRVLIKKLNDAGFETEFAGKHVDSINKVIKDAFAVLYYLDTDEQIAIDVLQFVKDHLTEYDKKIILVGEKNDIDTQSQRFTKELILDRFVRPLDYEKLIDEIKTLSSAIESGDTKKSIMIVDDDPTYLGLVREWLKDTYKVVIANSGMQAFKMLSKNKVDLILLDHEMPVTSGPQVLKMLRSEHDTADIPVIFLTGHRDRDSVLQVVGLKPEGYFLKDISKDELLEKLKEYFMRAKV